MQLESEAESDTFIAENEEVIRQVVEGGFDFVEHSREDIEYTSAIANAIDIIVIDAGSAANSPWRTCMDQYRDEYAASMKDSVK